MFDPMDNNTFGTKVWTGYYTSIEESKIWWQMPRDMCNLQASILQWMTMLAIKALGGGVLSFIACLLSIWVLVDTYWV
mgnify:CR=1 FL=1